MFPGVDAAKRMRQSARSRPGGFHVELMFKKDIR
jgi:hypothetical protein